MDTTDSLNANLPARLPAASSRLPAQVFVAPRELAAASPPSALNSRMLLRGLARNWWRILLVWLVLATPLTYLVYRYVEPTYQAYGLVKVESNQPDLFGPSMSRDGGGSQPTYLQTEIESIRSNPVLDLALSDPSIENQPMLKKTNSTDPKTDLRKKLDIQILPNTHWIKVAIESTAPDEARDIVNAVINAYAETTADEGAGNTTNKMIVKKDLTKITERGFQRKFDDLEKVIKDKREALIELAKRGNVEFRKPNLGIAKTDENEQSPQPTFNAQSLEQFRTTKDHLMQTEFQIMDLEARLAAKEAEALQQAQLAGDSRVLPNDVQLDQVHQEFKRDPEVASVIDHIKAITAELDHTKGVAKKGNDPARVDNQKRLTKLKDEYNELWVSKSERIRQRLLVATSAPGAPDLDSPTEIRRKIEVLRSKSRKLAELINKFDLDKQSSHIDTVKATFERDDLIRYYNMFDQVNRKLEQLKFNQTQAGISIEKIDPAVIPRVTYNNKRQKYMAILPVAVLFAVLGLFLLLEFKSERVGDPDLLSSRVQSEVFALPPLPTTRTSRKLSGPVIDDQIDRFIQRLDHLRFAVCGDHQGTALGRCVLVTSAVGGEGKTTLAAQLAARCGNAGISTLLIDADLRRSALCSLLDVPDGSGLSDVLEGAKIEDVVIPVQGGTFHLLCAGSPVQDTSRIFQGRNFPMLLAQLRQRYELIFIDSPPVLPVPDALMLGRWTDGALLAARFEISRSPQVERARRQLDKAGIPVLGTVINGMRSSDVYYGRYAYSRQQTPQSDPSRKV
jgi:succinoglycan biosynthesis transport protein ExoP